MNPDHYAKEAARLLADDVLNYTLDAVEAEAKEDLVLADVDDKTMILRLQQRVGAIAEIRARLRSAVNRVKTATSTGTVA